MPSKSEIVEKLCTVIEEEAVIISKLVLLAELHGILDESTVAEIDTVKKDYSDVLGAWPEGGEEA